MGGGGRAANGDRLVIKTLKFQPCTVKGFFTSDPVREVRDGMHAELDRMTYMAAGYRLSKKRKRRWVFFFLFLNQSFFYWQPNKLPEERFYVFVSAFAKNNLGCIVFIFIFLVNKCNR